MSEIKGSINTGFHPVMYNFLDPQIKGTVDINFQPHANRWTFKWECSEFHKNECNSQILGEKWSKTKKILDARNIKYTINID